jgi:hypothetical protein
MDDLIRLLVDETRRLTAANIVDGQPTASPHHPDLALYKAAFELLHQGDYQGTWREIHQAGFTTSDSDNLANRLATLHSQSRGGTQRAACGYEGTEGQWKASLAHLGRRVQKMTAGLKKEGNSR